MGDPQLLDMLAAEADRRGKTIIDGAEALAASGKADSAAVEALRVEAHGLKGAAMVVGESRLADLALGLERLLAAQTESGELDPAMAATVVAATSALREGAQAAAEGIGEPTTVGESLEKLST
jgi:chemotaxis protein histidine kinase CheA